jgi:hypothetical protein
MASSTGTSSSWKLDFSSVECLRSSSKLDPPGYDSALARDWVCCGLGHVHAPCWQVVMQHHGPSFCLVMTHQSQRYHTMLCIFSDLVAGWAMPCVEA